MTTAEALPEVEELLDRRAPQDLGAEAAVLGSMLLSPAVVADVREALASADFFSPRHTVVFDAISDMDERHERADVVTLTAHLANAGDLLRIGGAPFLHSLVAEVPTTANAGHYARIVAERATQRRLVEAGIRIAQLGYGAMGTDRTVSDLADLAQQVVSEVVPVRGSGDVSSLGELLQPALDNIESAARGDGANGVPTGFTDLDRLMNGLQPGQLFVVAARPGLGKSTFGLDVCRHLSVKLGLATGFFTLEMTKVEMVLRLLSAESRIPLHVLRSGQLSDDDWGKLATRMGEIADAPLYVDDTPSMSLAQIRAKALDLKRKYDLRLLVVDYLQLMSTPGRSESRQQEVAALSRGLKLLAKELFVPVIAVSQLNRGPEGRQDKRPQLSDLRESGAIEQDSDGVLFVHREDYYDKEHVRAGEADLILAKHRNGPTDTVTVAAQLHLSRFVDMAI